MSEPTEPKCPQCGGRLHEVTQNQPCMYNSDQFNSMKAGDYYCETCPDNGRAKRGSRAYFWESEVIKAAAPPPQNTLAPCPQEWTIKETKWPPVGTSMFRLYAGNTLLATFHENELDLWRGVLDAHNASLAPCPQRSRWIRTADQVPCKADARPYGYLLERWEDGGANYVPWQNVTAPYWMPLPELNEPLSPCPIKDEGEETTEGGTRCPKCGGKQRLIGKGADSYTRECWTCGHVALYAYDKKALGKPEASPATTGKGPMERNETVMMLKLRAADKMAWICDDWVQRHIIDARSALADARLSYGDPFTYSWSKLEAPSEGRVTDEPPDGTNDAHWIEPGEVPSPALPLPLSEEAKKDL